MEQIQNNTQLIAYCGLYCAACGSFKKGKCPGCHENSKATWCKIRSCNQEHAYNSCADCKEYANPKECAKYNNFIAKAIEFFSKTDRSQCITMIREKGYENFASFMCEKGWQSIKK